MLKNDTHRLLDERINAQLSVLLIFTNLCTNMRNLRK